MDFDPTDLVQLILVILSLANPDIDTDCELFILYAISVVMMSLMQSDMWTPFGQQSEQTPVTKLICYTLLKYFITFLYSYYKDIACEIGRWQDV